MLRLFISIICLFPLIGSAQYKQNDPWAKGIGILYSVEDTKDWTTLVPEFYLLRNNSRLSIGPILGANRIGYNEPNGYYTDKYGLRGVNINYQYLPGNNVNRVKLMLFVNLMARIFEGRVTGENNTFYNENTLSFDPALGLGLTSRLSERFSWRMGVGFRVSNKTYNMEYSTLVTETYNETEIGGMAYFGISYRLSKDCGCPTFD